jgi:hypothetical protein
MVLAQAGRVTQGLSAARFAGVEVAAGWSAVGSGGVREEVR